MQFDATAGTSLQKNVQEALTHSKHYYSTLNACAALVAVVANQTQDVTPFTFNYFGIVVPVAQDATVESVQAAIQEQLDIRAKQYAEVALGEFSRTDTHSGYIGMYVTAAGWNAVHEAQEYTNKLIAANALSSASRHVFEFNGHRVEFNPYTSGEKIAEEAMALQNKAHEEYVNSPKGKAAAAQQAARLAAAKDALVAHAGSLHTAFGQGTPSLMTWATGFGEAYDHTGDAKYNEEVLAAFESHGYVAGAYVGDDFRPLLETDKEAFGLYILGQFMELLKRKHGMPGILWHFAEQYHARA